MSLDALLVKDVHHLLARRKHKRPVALPWRTLSLLGQRAEADAAEALRRKSETRRALDEQVRLKKEREQLEKMDGAWIEESQRQLKDWQEAEQKKKAAVVGADTRPLDDSGGEPCWSLLESVSARGGGEIALGGGAAL